MFPIRDDNPHFLKPIATYGIIGLNLVAWVFVQGLGMEPSLSSSVCSLGLIPGPLLQTGPADAVCAVARDGAWYTTVTSMFMHGSWLHIGSNLWFLWIFGNNVEDSMGHVRFVIFYVVCGLAAAAVQVVTDPDSGIPVVGASGAIGGVMGAYILLYPRVHVHLLIFLGFYITTVAVPAYFMLGYWFVVQVFGGVSALGAEGGGVAFWAHIGGFAAGALLILLFRDRALLDQHPYHGWRRQHLPTKSWKRV